MLVGSVEGGQLTTTTQVDNYPGFVDGIDGNNLVAAMKNQALRFKTEMLNEQVSGCTKAGDLFEIKTDKNSYQTKTIIITTGASAKALGIPTEAAYRGKGISYCATCDGFFFKGKEVIVVGGGDTAMEDATFLTRFATKVTIIHRRDEFRASPIMLDRARHEPKITFLTNKVITEITGDPTISGVKLKDTVSGKESTLATGGIFVAIGHTPSTEFLKGFIDLDEKGYIVVKKISSLESQTTTTLPGVFTAGDCADPRYRQAIVAAGMGCMAAMDAEKYLESRKSA